MTFTQSRHSKGRRAGSGGKCEKKKQTVCVYFFLCVILYVVLRLARRPKWVDLD